jgi:membrane-bound lytic murein transglycosylase B
MEVGMRWFAVAVCIAWGTLACAEYTDRDSVKSYVDELVTEHDFDRDKLMAMFGAAERKQSILDAISRPAEKTKAWHEYRDIFLTTQRIEQGVAFWQDNREALERVAEEYGVAPEVVVAIIGVETRYGRNTGSYRVVDALSTLAFDYPPRSDFFRGELTEFLLLAREEGKQPLELKGSYAGAMGYGQFIPSSYRAYAVDFDGDGLRDIWKNPTDAIGSVGNYFKRHGWDAGDGVVVSIDANDALDGIANKSLKLKFTIGELKELGVHDTGLPNDTKVAVFKMEGDEGPEYYLGLNNFYVITRYNRSRLYALAVHQLSQAIFEQAKSEQADTAEELAAR